MGSFSSCCKTESHVEVPWGLCCSKCPRAFPSSRDSYQVTEQVGNPPSNGDDYLRVLFSGHACGMNTSCATAGENAHVVSTRVVELLFERSIVKEVEDTLKPVDLTAPLDDGVLTLTRPVVQEPDGTLYRGEWTMEGQKHGRGHEIYPDGSKFQGYFQNGLPSKYGRLIRANGHVYEGEFLEGKAHGQGTYTTPQGFTYTGEWRRDQYHGTGKESTRDGFEYEGEYKKGHKDGKGMYRLPDGSVYIGTMHKNKKHGHGEYVDEDRVKYTGNWEDDEKHGQGTMEWPDGRKYVGSFVHSEKNGHGVMHWPSGKTYEGMWKEGVPHGRGVMSSTKSGIVRRQEGVWVNGVRNSGRSTSNDLAQ